MRTLLSLQVALLFVLSGILPTRAATYYVATDGSDNNNGTTTITPFKTIQKAINVALYGDVINVKLGIYREKLVLNEYWDDSPNDNGSAINMLTIQAWDIDNDPEIHDAERPTITASSLFDVDDDWDLVTDATKWAELTGWDAGDFPTHPHKDKIYVTPLVVAPTVRQPPSEREKYDTVNLVMQVMRDSQTDELIESDTPLTQTRWAGNGVDVPAVKPFMNEPGTYYYDTANEMLYVWRFDNQPPGWEYPIETQEDKVSSSHPPPIYSQVPFLHLKGLKFRHSNTTFWGKSGVSLDSDSKVEYCDIQWMDWQGLSCKKNCEIIDTTISNNGNKGASVGEGSKVINCDIERNNFRIFGGSESAGIKIVGGAVPPSYYGSSAGSVFSGNRFIGNVGHALWFDFQNAPVANRCVIANNFFADNAHIFPNGQRGVETAIRLELSSGYKIYNNIMHDGGIRLIRSRDNIIVHNTMVVPDRNWAGTPPGTLEFDANASEPIDTTGNVLAYNLLISLEDGCMFAAYKDTDGTDNWRVHDNVYKYNQLWNMKYAPPTPPQMNLHPGTIDMYNVSDYFTALAESPQTSANVGNRAAEPDFFVVTLPTSGLAPEDFDLKWESPAKDVAGTEFGITTDIFGTTRDSYPDLGAIEISNADSDSDGLADVWEMFYVGNLTTFGTSTDYDNDSFSDVVEFGRGTKPNSNTSKNVTLYSNNSTGHSSLDGFSATKTSFIRGPKATITSALTKSLTGDTVRVAGGTYSENVDISSLSISFELDGNVVLQ